ncbi:RelA/SpoT domain-containing protein [Corallococcus sp. bb12-1]|uniref:RelA/SpoT domain-containing protein n=1 Tax=Corallococcus sp. bb12-1 TaxID=2996784 RepID=UPI0022714463|nr:RelA/SpoT domain-containing protein [Corallococcus sp. bb12-1]MCY1042111.1 RelA/SpoT domain-containing protein [Corallococcus sp. bb12-1]
MTLGIGGLLVKEQFLKKFNISEEKFAKSKIEWAEMMKIHADYVGRMRSLQPTLNYVREQLGSAEGVHSIKARLKDPEHLIEKIIRKSIDNPEEVITKEAYWDRINDLIGIRVLHLFKADWIPIHEFIVRQWALAGKVEAKVRDGDSAEFIAQLEGRGCSIVKSPAGYRSVHYLIESRPGKEKFLAEIQVRTLFEEGWSEVDHLVRYPYGAASPVVESFLGVFNRLAGGADEMASFVMTLRNEIVGLSVQHQAAASKLENTISELKIASNEKAKLQEELRRLKAMYPGSDLLEGIFSVNDSWLGDVASVSKLSLGNWMTIDDQTIDDQAIDGQAIKLGKVTTKSSVLTKGQGKKK